MVAFRITKLPMTCVVRMATPRGNTIAMATAVGHLSDGGIADGTLRVRVRV